MKIKNLFMFIAMAAVALTGCNKDNDGDGGQTGNGTFNMMIQFDIVSTKADVDKQVIDGVTLTEFTEGALFFIDDNEAVLRMAIIADSPAGAVTPAQIQEGYLFTDVSETAKKVIVVGNHHFDITDTYATLTEIETITKDILSQTNQNGRNTFGVEDATLYGAGNIVPASPATQSKFYAYPNITVEREAIFSIEPIIARMEIDKITAEGDIDGFKLEGIYINNFYTKMSVIGTTDLLDLVHNGTTLADRENYQQETTPPGKYLTAWKKYLFDDVLTASTNLISHEPDNETWAYNVFANGTAVPHIILHFTGVEINGSPRINVSLDGPSGGSNNGVAYLTITGYLTKGTQKDQPILGGNVYELQNIIFDEDDLTDYPYEEDDKEAVYVEVSVTPWNVIAVDWK
ncbi:MAG: hypothetical protein LUE98_01515 [Tannerellaceae bacterium]|nr:hypothetical protein [Tannerellaceae bacterium]